MRMTQFLASLLVLSSCSSEPARRSSDDSWMRDAAPEAEAPGSDASPQGASDARTGSPQDALTATFVRSTVSRDPASADAGSVTSQVDENAQFAWDLYHRLSTRGDNLIFSPFSVSVAMAMAWAGAKGQTAEEIQRVFHFADPVSTHAAMNALTQQISVDTLNLKATLANALWVAPQIVPLPAYLDVLAAHYGAGVGVVDLSQPTLAANTINGWVAQETADTIQELLSPEDLDGNVTAVLTNAAYFKARWAAPFSTSTTSDAAFTRADGTNVTVSMMSDQQTIPYASGADYRAGALRYTAAQGRTFEMLVILPTVDLELFEASMNSEKLVDISAALRPQLVDVGVPRFELRSALSLKGELSALGMPTAFGAADFSGISAPPPGRIQDVIHQGFVSVDEAGTEASGATAILFADGSASFLDALPPTLWLDHPFLFLIRNVETQTILFMGRVADPSG